MQVYARYSNLPRYCRCIRLLWYLPSVATASKRHTKLLIIYICPLVIALLPSSSDAGGYLHFPPSVPLNSQILHSHTVGTQHGKCRTSHPSTLLFPSFPSPCPCITELHVNTIHICHALLHLSVLGLDIKQTLHFW